MYFDSSCCNGFAKVANERHKQTNITVSTLYLLRRVHWNFDFELLSSLGFYHSKPPIFCHHSPLTSKTCRKVFSNPPHHSHITPWLCSLIVASSAHSLNLIFCGITTNLHFKWQTPASWQHCRSPPHHHILPNTSTTAVYIFFTSITPTVRLSYSTKCFHLFHHGHITQP